MVPHLRVEKDRQVPRHSKHAEKQQHHDDDVQKPRYKQEANEVRQGAIIGVAVVVDLLHHHVIIVQVEREG